MKFVWLSVLFWSVAPSVAAEAPVLLHPQVQLETFEEYRVTEFPTRWQALRNAATARTIYRIAEEDGNRFLHAHAEQQGIQIGLTHLNVPCPPLHGERAHFLFRYCIIRLS